MRAWLLLLAVLATFQPIVQVASTEDITSSFIQAISPTIIEEEQQQQQQDLFELAKQRDTRTIYNNNNKNNNNNNKNNSAQQLVAASRQLTAISPVIDITALSVTKRTQSATTTKAKTAIATIFSYNRRSDNYTNNGNNLKQFSAKDIKANGSGATNSDATTAIVVAVQEKQKQKQKINKQITKTNQKHNEVNDKHNNLIEITRNKNNNNNSSAVQVQQLANTSDKTKSAQATTTAKSTKKLKATTSAVLSEQVEAEVEEEAEKIEMAIQEHTLATAQEHSKRHRNHKKQQQQHRQQQKQQHMQQQQQHKQQQQHLMQQQHSAAQHTATGASTHLATAERLAASEATTTTHLEAAEKLAQDASRAANTPATRTSAASDASTDDEGDSESDVTEPATYSNKEIIGDKLKPDPSTLVQIENSLLSLFNMKRPPKIDRSKIIIPEAMKQLYAQIMGHELDMETIRRPSMLSRSANTVRSFTHIESKIDDRFPHHHRFRLYFNVKSIPTEEKLRAADLQLSREAISDAVLSERLANRTSYQVLVYDITRVGVRGKREPSYKLLDNKLVHLNSTDTVSLDVQRAVDRWLATPKKNYGLLIEVRTLRTLKPAPHHHVRLRRSVDEPHDSWQHKQPVLYAYTDDGKHRMRSARDATTSSSRSKRAGHHRRAHRRKNSDEICRRHSLYVDFADVGWSDWIVAPPGYDAFYCQGKCPFPLAEHLNSTNHAVVQTLVNNLNPGKVPKACCVPTQLEGISMLYLNDQNTVVLKNYQDMTVVGCGCR